MLNYDGARAVQYFPRQRRRQRTVERCPGPGDRGLGDIGAAGHALQSQNVKIVNSDRTSTARIYGVRKSGWGGAPEDWAR